MAEGWEQKQSIRMADLNPHITAITLNEPNVSIKRKRTPARIKKKKKKTNRYDAYKR